MKALENEGFVCFAIAVVSAVIVSALLISGVGSGFSVSLSDSLYDRRPEPEDIVVVKIDDRSIQDIGRWPWDRDVFAEAVRELNSSSVIGIDVSFFEKSNREDDRKLAQALNRSTAVLASEYSYEGEKRYTKSIFDAPYGHVNLLPGEDSVVRFAPLHIDGRPSFDLKIAQKVKELPLATPSKILIPFYEDPTTVPFSSVLEGETDVSFKDKIVLIGVTAPNLHDRYQTPVSKQREMPGVVVHANILNSLLRGDSLQVQQNVSILIYIFLLAALCALVFWLLPISYAFPSALLIGLGYFALAEYRFGTGVVYDLFYPLLSLGLTAVGSTMGLYCIETFNRRWITEAFGKYVSDDVVDDILEKADGGLDIGLEGQKRTITIMFADIRGFTSFSENKPPEEVVESLNQSLQDMTDSILRSNGTVDKYIGDEVMAFWNAPVEQEDHAIKAVRAAVEMAETEHPEGLKYGLGINTGEAVVGNIGSTERLEYTAIGDSINVAARLCDMAGPGQILITRETKERLDNSFKVEHHGDLQVKGREEPVEIYEVML